MKEWLKKSKTLRNIYRFVIAFFVPLHVIVANRKAMKAFKNKYKGQRCFVVGNGPSLTPKDLDMLKGEYCFGANRIYKAYAQTKWRPTFYCVQDLDILVEIGDELDRTSDLSEYTFIRMKGYSKIKEKVHKLRNPIFVPVVEAYVENQGVKFSKKADKFVYDGWTVTYMSIELAAYMGFSEIYLVGVDHNFPFIHKSDGQIVANDLSLAAHFYETPKDNLGEDAYKRRTSFYERTTNGYYTAEKFSREDGSFRIYNATRGGKLEAFERVDFDSLFRNK